MEREARGGRGRKKMQFRGGAHGELGGQDEMRVEGMPRGRELWVRGLLVFPSFLTCLLDTSLSI